MSGPFKRRPSLKALPPAGLSLGPAASRRPSVIPIKSSVSALNQPQETPWDLLDRCLLPIIFCHAAATIASTVLNVLNISQVTTFTLFILFTIVTVAVILIYHNLKVSVSGKAVLITGCDSRLGSALARHLDEQGFTVFAGFQNAIGSALAAELKEECSARVHILQLDVASETQILAASLYASEHLPDGASGLWALVHAAAWVALGEIEWVPPQVLKKAAEINLLGPTRVTQVMLPLIRRAHGRVVMLSSALCRVASPVRGIYCSLLAALEAQAECLRKELRSRGVDVVVVASGDFSAGSTWLSDDIVLQQAKDMWSHMCTEQKTEYGEEYFEKAVRSLEHTYSSIQGIDLTLTLRALNDAIIRTFPLARYTPVTKKEKLQALIAEYLPRSIYDVIYS